MSDNSASNTLSQAANLINNPFGRAVLQSQFSKMIPADSSSIMGKIFTPQIRSYFNVNNSLVMKKILKILVPFKSFEWDQQINKLELYLPIISFVTLLLFSTLVQGITKDQFQPKMGRKAIWIIIFSFMEIIAAKCSQNKISNLNIGFMELTSLVSYRFVPLSLLTIILTVTNMSIPYLNIIGLVYLLITDTYFCKLELSSYAHDMFKQQGLGTKIALGIHFLTTLIISWLCDLI